MYIYVFFESIILVILVYVLFYFLFYKSEVYYEMISSYECGFDPKSEARFVFSYSFFLVSILFIIFDVEISLMISVPFFMMSELGVFVFFFFVFVLIVGLLYEYYYGSLDWLLYCED